MSFKQDYLTSFKRLDDERRHKEIKSLMADASRGVGTVVGTGLTELRDSVRARQDDLARGQRDAAEQVTKELAFFEQQLGRQLDGLERTVQDVGTQVSGSVEAAARYLGAELSHISYLLYLQGEVGRETLRILKESLDNESRQFFNQGVRAFEQNEPGIARECFERALAANRTNAVVYQYLGFIAVDEDDPRGAIRNFELAAKFADDGRGRARALYHLSNCRCAQGDPAQAKASMDEAVAASDREAWLWYERAKVCALAGSEACCDESLEKAVRLDWSYWARSVVDPGFDRVPTVATTVRTRTKEAAKARLEQEMKDMAETGRRLAALTSGEAGVTGPRAAIRTMNQALQSENLYEYLDMIRAVPELARLVREGALEELEQRLDAARARAQELSGELGQAKQKFNAAIAELRRNHAEAVAAREKSIGNSGDGTTNALMFASTTLTGCCGLVLIVLVLVGRIRFGPGGGIEFKIANAVILGALTLGASLVMGTLAATLGPAVGPALRFFRKRRNWRDSYNNQLDDDIKRLTSEYQTYESSVLPDLHGAEATIGIVSADVEALKSSQLASTS